MGRLLIGDLNPVMNVDPKAVPYQPKGVAGAVDKWGRVLKLGNDFVSSNLGKGLMDAAGGVASNVAGRFEDLSAVLDQRKTDDLTRAAQEMMARETGTPGQVTEWSQPKPAGLHEGETDPDTKAWGREGKRVAPPVRYTPGQYPSQVFEEMQAKLGAEYTKLSEVAERSPDPKVVTAADKRMKAIEAQLEAMKVQQEPLDRQEFGLFNEARMRKIGLDRRSDDGRMPDPKWEPREGERPPAVKQYVDVKARGMPGGALEYKETDKPVEPDSYELLFNEEVEKLSTKTRSDYERAKLVMKHPKWYSAKEVRAAGALIGQVESGLDKTVESRFVGREMETSSGGYLPEDIKAPVETPAPETPTGPSELPEVTQLRARHQAAIKAGDNATVRAVEARMKELAVSGALGPVDKPPVPKKGPKPVTGGYSREDDVPEPEVTPDDTPAATPKDKPKGLDAFDSVYDKFAEQEPKVIRDERHPMKPYTVYRAQTPTSEDIQTLAAMADTPERQGKVLDLIGKRPFKPSSLFDFTGGGETARFVEQTRKLFPKTTALTEYQSSRLKLDRDKVTQAQTQFDARAKAAAEKLEWDKRKWDEWKTIQFNRMKANRKGRAGDPLKADKDAYKILKETEDEADKRVKQLDKNLADADEEAKKTEQRAREAEAEAGVEPGKKLTAPASLGAMAGDEERKQHAKDLDKYEDNKRAQAKAKAIREAATEAKNRREAIGTNQHAARQDALRTKEAAKRQRESVGKKISGGK